MPFDGRLDQRFEYGQHITLCCVNHPGLKWSTKNIAPIGCRKIFFNLMNEPMAQFARSILTTINDRTKTADERLAIIRTKMEEKAEWPEAVEQKAAQA